MLEDSLLQNIPWAILLLPLAGFISLALFGDAIRREHDETGAGLMACGTVLASFGLAVWSTLRLEALLAGPDRLRPAAIAGCGPNRAPAARPARP